MMSEAFIFDEIGEPRWLLLWRLFGFHQQDCAVRNMINC